jgi:hypothetical protein
MVQARDLGAESFHQQHWMAFMEESVAEERELNDKFLAETDEIMQNQGASQCCYWACKTPHGNDGRPLSRCTGCKIVKYCCKEHQALDWDWEHKAECTSVLPDWYKAELEADRERNLRGDYGVRL